jgi:prepilin-type N-terminal cleavage/methylation domain-containing protein
VHYGTAMQRRRTPSRARGFTLVEVMVTVAIVGILAALAIYGVRKYVTVSKTSEPIEIINAVRAAEEAYKDETFRYLGTTANLTSYHPGAPTGGKRSWAGSGDAAWTQLGVSVSAPVSFGYACVAGAANATVPSVGASVSGNLGYPTTSTTPFYIVKAIGDDDADGTYALLVGSSFTDEIYSEKTDE